MKKRYFVPDAQILAADFEDVICASGFENMEQGDTEVDPDEIQ